MRSATLILLAGVALASCQGPHTQKSVDPRAVPATPPATAPKAAAAPSTPPAGPTPADAPRGGSPGMGFMPDYEGGGDGMRIADVRPDGAAAKAGIQAGDVVVEFAGIPVGDVQEYMAALETVKVGDAIEIVVKRGSETKRLKATVGVSNR